MAVAGDERQRDESQLREESGGTVLLVEDEAALRDPISRMLRKRGYSVIEAESGNRAVEIFRTWAREVGVVLLDMTLPGKSGPEVLAEIRKINPRVKVILTTAYSEEKVLSEVGREASWGFIRKPYRIRDLISLLQVALRPPQP